MQVGNLGSEHDTHMHNVSNCVHESPVITEKTGGMQMLKTHNETDTVELSAATEDIQDYMSGQSWLSRLSGNIKKIWGFIWGESSAAEKMSEASEKDSADKSVNAVYSVNTQNDASTAAQTEKQHQAAAAAGNPYFQPIDNTVKPAGISQIIKLKIHEVSGYLAKHFSFSGKNDFDTGQNQQKDDLRKRSRYRDDNIEIDCTLTDDSYLLDSYDRKGSYSKLSTKL
jgi:hypothetical protein